MNNNLLTISQASKLLHVSQRTLRNWEKDGKISSVKTVGGHRRYSMIELNKFLDIKEEKTKNESNKVNKMFIKVQYIKKEV